MSIAVNKFHDGERVVTLDGRAGKVLWTIPSGRSVVLALDGDDCSIWYCIPEHLRHEQELAKRDGEALNDTASIERCVELAKTVWPEWRFRVHVNGAGYAAVVTSCGVVLLSIKHSRSLRALEVALRELAR